MSSGIRAYVRQHHLGLVAIFIALSGTAYAVDGPLAGQNTVGSQDIINGEVTNQDLGANSVGEGKILDDSVEGRDVKAETLTGTDILDDSLTGAELGAASVGAAEVADGALSGADILDGGVTGSDIATGTVTGGDIATGTVSGVDILDNGISGGEIATNTLTGADINESSLTTVPDASAIDGIDSAQLGIVDFGRLVQAQGGGEQILLRGQMGTLNSRCQSDGDATLKYVNSLTTPQVDVADNVGGATEYHQNIASGASVFVLDLSGTGAVTSGQVQAHTEVPGPQEAVTFFVSVQSGNGSGGGPCNFMGQALYSSD